MFKSIEEQTEKLKYPRINSWCGWDSLEEVWVGRHHSSDYWNSLKNKKKITDPLKRISDETEEDYQSLIKILKDFGVKKILRPEFSKNIKYGDDQPSHATNPRDYHFVYGNKLWRFEDKKFYDNLYKEYTNQGHAVYDPYSSNTDIKSIVSHKLPAPQCVRFGDAILIDKQNYNKYKCFKQNFKDKKIFVSVFGGHSDGAFCPVKPNLIVTLWDYKINFKDTIFKGWEFLYLKNQSFEKVTPILGKMSQMLKKTNNRWYLKGEENNNEFINFVDTYLNDWVGYCAESVFDVNMLVLDQHNVIVNSYNKEVFDMFKKHKIQPIICNLRHRFFWDGGLHCNTLDIRRRGKKERYLNY